MILGIETSCDETAVALVTREGDVRANVVASQAELHARYGGVVPEVASRRHLELVGPVLVEALEEAAATLDDARNFFIDRNRFATRPRGLTAYVDDVRALSDHLFGVGECRIDRNELSAVAEAIRGDIKNAHDERALIDGHC